MPAAAGGHHGARDQLAALGLIDLELSGVPKMGIDHSVFIGYCNLHHVNDLSVFRERFPGIRSRISRKKRTATAAAATGAGLRAEPVFSPLHPKSPPTDQCVRQLAAGPIVDRLHRGAGDLHPGRRLLLGAAEMIDQPDHLVFLHRQNHRPVGRWPQRCEPGAVGQRADSPAFLWSRHPPSPLSGRSCSGFSRVTILPLFLT